MPPTVQTDLFDNADGTDPNQRYVMNLVDLATKFVLELYALRTKSAKEVLLVVSAAAAASLHWGCCRAAKLLRLPLSPAAWNAPCRHCA